MVEPGSGNGETALGAILQAKEVTFGRMKKRSMIRVMTLEGPR